MSHIGHAGSLSGHPRGQSRDCDVLPQGATFGHSVDASGCYGHDGTLISRKHILGLPVWTKHESHKGNTRVHQPSHYSRINATGHASKSTHNAIVRSLLVLSLREIISLSK